MALAAAFVLLAACNPASLLPREVDRRPELPEPEPFPILVEDAIPRLEEDGWRCQYSPDSDIPGGWHCNRGPIAPGRGFSLGITSQETGPIEFISSSVYVADQELEDAPDQSALDAMAAEAFGELVLRPILPEDAQPPLDVLQRVVADNFQMGVGDGYYLVFHRNHFLRTMLMHYGKAD